LKLLDDVGMFSAAWIYSLIPCRWIETNLFRQCTAFVQPDLWQGLGWCQSKRFHGRKHVSRKRLKGLKLAHCCLRWHIIVRKITWNAALLSTCFGSTFQLLYRNHLLTYSTVFFKKVRARLGGNVRCMISGSAPLSSEVMEFLRVAFACEVLEGYGQTETSAGSTMVCCVYNLHVIKAFF
jgi:hypothetical protein